MRIGRVERSLRSRLEAGEKLVFILVDPEKPPSRDAIRLVASAGVDAFFLGGSLNVTTYEADECAKLLKDEAPGTPVIVFPGGLTNLTRFADAVLYMMLMNSLDPYWLVGAQVAAAPLIRKLGLEAIPSAYIIYGFGGAAGHIGRAQPIPEGLDYLVAAYASAAELMGKRLVYIEAGSGSPRPVPVTAVAAARRAVEDAMIVVGGGIRSPEAAVERLKAGADAIVIGTLFERDPEAAARLVEAIKRS